MSKILVVLLILFLLPLTACKGKQITKDYPSLQDTKNIIEYVTIDEVLNNLEKLDKKIIVFGFKKCPWCQSCIRPLNDVAVELGFKSVWYLDIKNMRDNEDDVNHKKYLQLCNLIKDNIGNPEKILAPTVIMVKNNPKNPVTNIYVIFACARNEKKHTTSITTPRSRLTIP